MTATEYLKNLCVPASSGTELSARQCSFKMKKRALFSWSARHAEKEGDAAREMLGGNGCSGPLGLVKLQYPKTFPKEIVQAFETEVHRSLPTNTSLSNLTSPRPAAKTDIRFSPSQRDSACDRPNRS